MKKVAQEAMMHERDGMRTITIESGHDTLHVNELEDGANMAVLSPTIANGGAGTVLDAEQLMQLTRELAGWFGHALVHPQEWREKLRSVIGRVCEEHEARCLDDDIDRRVVVNALLRALVPETP